VGNQSGEAAGLIGNSRACPRFVVPVLCISGCLHARLGVVFSGREEGFKNGFVEGGLGVTCFRWRARGGDAVWPDGLEMDAALGIHER
jgi:hypothetical protein